MFYKLWLLVFLLSLMISSIAQTLPAKMYGVNVGLHLAVGTHFQRLGVSCHGYYIIQNFQLNPGFEIYYNFKNVGPSKKYFEIASSVGGSISFGKIDSSKNLFYTALSNQSIKRNSFGYSFNYYYNKIKTTQATGTISLQFGRFQVISENDLFAGGIRDEFRTGSLLVQYRDNNFQYGMNFTAWTGKRGIHVDDPNFPSRNGYMDMSQSLYGNVSAGLISAQIQYAAPYGQVLQGNIGFDGEKVRNFFQNKLIHDLFFAPKNGQWKGGSRIPMNDTNGKMYLYKKGQKVKPSTLYFNLFVNPNLFY